jgi:hypothetical protein
MHIYYELFTAHITKMFCHLALVRFLQGFSILDLG